MRILITGACGFIGSHLAEHFTAGGHEVTGIDNLSTGREGNYPSDLPLVVGDIADEAAIKRAFAFGRPDVVYHCAASYHDQDAWETDTRTNVQGTIAVVREALAYRVQRLVYFQTSLCYGLAPKSPVTPDHPIDPTSSYAISKTAAEQYIRLSGIDFCSLRLANIYGPRNLSGPAPTFFRRLTNNQPCTVVDTRRDFVFVDDLVDIAARMAHPDAPGGIWHVGSGGDAPIIDVYEAVRAELNLSPPAPSITPRGEDDAVTILVDPTLTREQFDWSATTPLREGIARAVEWYLAHGVERTYTHLAMRG